MKLDVPTLTDFAIEVAIEADAQSLDAAHYGLMASHVSEMVSTLKDSDAHWVLASSLVFLLVENFYLQQRLLRE